MHPYSMRLFCCALLGLLCWSPAIIAHPAPRHAFDRTIVVTPTSSKLLVEYRLDVDATTVFRTVPSLDPEIDLVTLRGPSDFFRVFKEKMAIVLADRLFAQLDGKTLSFEVLPSRSEEGENYHLSCFFTFEVAWNPEPNQDHQLLFQELNFPDDPTQLEFPGKIDLNLNAEKIELVSAEVPTEELKQRPDLDRTPADDEALRTLSTTFRVPEDQPVETDSAEEEDSAVPPPSETKSLWQRLRQQGLPVLFDSDYAVGLLLLIAVIFGAAHALTPGHGKTLVAAYLVGERGTTLHAFILGVVTTITHTGTVILIALILWVLYPDTVPAHVQTALGFVGGLLIAGLGFWLLLRRVAGQADHVHVFGGHHHHHHDGHTHDHRHGHHHDHHHHHDHVHQPQGGWGRLVVLGISGGIVPCWDAVALLGIAITANRLWLGVPLLLAFSAGLAAVLIALGVTVVYAKKFGGKKFGEQRWFKALPVISAALLIIIGVWLCRDSLRPHEEAPAKAAPTEEVVQRLGGIERSM